ncbi:capsular polysaccharide export protein, LipB/KpsS family [Vibrio owensii]|uniref:capsular polysaccharide export protein, LipB/KpsS family n=1 Tax=Vibrio owensii TaxID=696485 RepID=UPI0005EDB4C6|nr:hypothetical protein [Vibrio owensii]
MKKVISLDFYADFSRFFSLVCKDLNESSVQVEWLHLCLFPSSLAYCKIHRRKSLFVPLLARKSNNHFLSVSEEQLRDLLVYHGSSDKDLEAIAECYLSYFYKVLCDNKPDLVIISGDSRLPARCLKLVTEYMDIKTLFFEQGPRSTTLLDKKGVNANCSFRDENFLQNDFSHQVSGSGTWNGYKKYRVLDIATQISRLFRFKELPHYVIKLGKREDINYGHFDLDSNDYCLLILQVPEDANMVLHSPYFDSHSSIVTAVHSNLPPGITLIVREHPLYQGKYENSLYDYISEHNIAIDRDSNLCSLIEHAKFVVVNNSTVGFDTLLKGVPLVVLGDSYYDNEKYCYKYKGKNLSELLELVLRYGVKVNSVERANYILSNNFIEGHFRSAEPGTFKSVSSRIHNELF